MPVYGVNVVIRFSEWRSLGCSSTTRTSPTSHATGSHQPMSSTRCLVAVIDVQGLPTRTAEDASECSASPKTAVPSSSSSTSRPQAVSPMS